MPHGSKQNGPIWVDGVLLNPQPEYSPWAKHWYVDGTAGSNGYRGDSPKKPFLTMAVALAAARSGDVVHLRGLVREQLTTPQGLFDVTVVGPSPVTRHPDSHTALETYGGQRSARWAAPATPTASTPLVKVSQQGWRFINILFTGDEDDSVGCIQAFRDAGSGDAEDDASHMQVIGCRFQGGLYGIQDSGGCARVKIYGNEFLTFDQTDNDAIVNVTGAGVGTMWGWEIIGNKFYANYSDIDISASGPLIKYNDFYRVSLGTTNTIGIDATGATEEIVSKNWMHSDSALAGSINARFTDSASTTSAWGPNYYSDKEEYLEPAE